MDRTPRTRSPLSRSDSPVSSTSNSSGNIKRQSTSNGLQKPLSRALAGIRGRRAYTDIAPAPHQLASEPGGLEFAKGFPVLSMGGGIIGIPMKLKRQKSKASVTTPSQSSAPPLSSANDVKVDPIPVTGEITPETMMRERELLLQYQHQQQLQLLQHHQLQLQRQQEIHRKQQQAYMQQQQLMMQQSSEQLPPRRRVPSAVTPGTNPQTTGYRAPIGMMQRHHTINSLSSLRSGRTTFQTFREVPEEDEDEDASMTSDDDSSQDDLDYRPEFPPFAPALNIAPSPSPLGLPNTQTPEPAKSSNRYIIRRSKIRQPLTKAQITVLEEWVSNNRSDPYPKETQKRELEQKTGASRRQIDDWFSNYRRKSFYKTSTPDLSSGSVSNFFKGSKLAVSSESARLQIKAWLTRGMSAGRTPSNEATVGDMEVEAAENKNTIVKKEIL